MELFEALVLLFNLHVKFNTDATLILLKCPSINDTLLQGLLRRHIGQGSKPVRKWKLFPDKSHGFMVTLGRWDGHGCMSLGYAYFKY